MFMVWPTLVTRMAKGRQGTQASHTEMELCLVEHLAWPWRGASALPAPLSYASEALTTSVIVTHATLNSHHSSMILTSDNLVTRFKYVVPN